MKILELQQNSEEWLEFRKGKSGGSEFGNIWSVSLPTKTAIIEKLESDGWDVVILWECEIRNHFEECMARTIETVASRRKKRGGGPSMPAELPRF